MTAAHRRTPPAWANIITNFDDVNVWRSGELASAGMFSDRNHRTAFGPLPVFEADESEVNQLWTMSPASHRSMGVLHADERCDWRSLAACLSADPDLFFPVSATGESVAQVGKAKAICARCVVRHECLAFALRTHQAYGVWGGMSEEERQQVNGLRPAP
jgi:WhiB family transcriptional regulator, redox-sensing transcriptional regulator